MAVDPRNFLLNTDYPLDQIILLHPGSINFTTEGTDYQFAHGLGFTPLVKATWSTTANFATTYGVGDGPISSSPSTPFLPELSFARADSTNVYLSWGNPGAVTDAYIRVYGFMPSDVNVDVEPTASSADDFVLNTDYNYAKLYMENVTASSSSAGTAETATHSLGYHPQVEVWYEKGGYIWASTHPVIYDSATKLSEAYIVTTSALVMYRDPSLAGTERFHYRIYADEL